MLFRSEELALERNVYFIMDEFGNMPKIEKFDKFITVGRSRKIWFTMIVQSYSQLNNVYGELQILSKVTVELKCLSAQMI